jgi:uncharacterized protein YkwD
MNWLASLLAWALGLLNPKLADPLAGYVVKDQVAVVQTTPIPEPTEIELTPTLVPTKRQIKIVPTKIPIRVVPTVGEWGVARQVGEHTWTMNVGMDERMGTPREILEALNEYRVRRGSQRLTWDENLANYAQSRADYLNSIGRTDEHKGFVDFLNNQNGYDKLGFTWVGENISIGYKMEGVHLIEWIYAGDKPHDDNQVNNRWNYVGIGVRGTATAVIFGTGKK